MPPHASRVATMGPRRVEGPANTMARAPRSAAKKPRLRALPGRPAQTSHDEATLAYARGVLEAEARAILGVTERLGAPFLRAVELVRGCAVQVVVTGMGKAGHIGQKLSATLASTGVR